MAQDASDRQSRALSGDAERQAAMRFHEDIATNMAGKVTTIKVQPGDSIREIGRDFFQTNKGRQPTSQELIAFENDVARRNELKTRDQRDNIAAGSNLVVYVPTRDGRVAASTAKVQAAPRHAQQTRQVAQRQPTVPTRDASATKRANASVSRETPAISVGDGAPTCSGSWEDVNMVARWVTHNEAGPKSYMAFNPNDMGHGISVGLMQWNQKRGKLPDLLQAWHRKNPAKFDGMFGHYSDDLLSTSFVKGADFTNGTLKTGMERALADPEFQRVQLTMRNNHIENSCEIAKDYQFTALRARAIVADLVNQMGEAGARRLLARVPSVEKIPNPSTRIERLKVMTDGRVNGDDRVASIEDRVREIWRQK